MSPVDMSAHAVTVRLQRVSQLRKLCLSLGRAKPVRKEPAPEPPPFSADSR
jgi:hypothetical protein